MSFETRAIAPDGSEVKEIIISSGDLTAKILSFGAVLRDLRLEGIAHPLVLGLDRVEDYFAAPAYLGAIVGPVANRVSGAAFTVQGQRFELDANEGVNTLHGGAAGTFACNWAVAEATRTSVTLSLSLPDGHGGFPGPMELTAIYSVDGSTLNVTLSASAEQATVAMLAPHPYFNLDGTATIDAHRLRIAAKHRLPMRAGIPSGAPAAVARTPYDLRTARARCQTGWMIITACPKAGCHCDRWRSCRLMACGWRSAAQRPAFRRMMAAVWISRGLVWTGAAMAFVRASRLSRTRGLMRRTSRGARRPICCRGRRHRRTHNSPLFARDPGDGAKSAI